MISATATLWTIPASSHSSLSAKLSKNNTFRPKHMELKLRNKNGGNRWLQSVCSSGSEISSIPQSQNLSLTVATSEVGTSRVAVAEKLHLLVSEFKSLSGAKDRVKRLLQFAEALPPMEESARVAENRVKGCATRVWLIAEMDRFGRMRFRADSDSEISRGFCGCLIWMLDGAEAKEVLKLETKDLADMNVGLPLKAESRVNTWQNVLFSMQKATKALLL